MIPYVIFLDLDGTIVGDVSDHLNDWLIDKKVREISGRSAHTNFSKHLKWSLENGLMRPHFSEFMHTVFSQHGIEVFIATMSTKDWATVMIKNIEYVVGKKFSRPIFSRETFETGRKSLTVMRPHVFAVLKKKYAELKHPDQLNGRMLLIDNTDILEERSFWVRCRTYDFFPHHDLLRPLDFAFVAKHFRALRKKMIECDIIRRQPETESDLYLFLSSYYAKLARQFHISAEKNAKELRDTFWRNCTKRLLPRLFAANGDRLENIVEDVNSTATTSSNGKKYIVSRETGKQGQVSHALMHGHR